MISKKQTANSLSFIPDFWDPHWLFALKQIVLSEFKEHTQHIALLIFTRNCPKCLWTLDSDKEIPTMIERQPVYKVMLNVLGIFFAGHWFWNTAFPFHLLPADLFDSWYCSNGWHFRTHTVRGDTQWISVCQLTCYILQCMWFLELIEWAR